MLVGISLAMTGILVMYPYTGPTPSIQFINQTDLTGGINQETNHSSIWNFGRDYNLHELDYTLPSCYNASTSLNDGNIPNLFRDFIDNFLESF